MRLPCRLPALGSCRGEQRSFALTSDNFLQAKAPEARACPRAQRGLGQLPPGLRALRQTRTDSSRLAVRLAFKPDTVAPQGFRRYPPSDDANRGYVETPYWTC